MNVPANLKYADSHEWMRAEPDGTVTVGITDHAQAALGDLVFIELPAVGREAGAGTKKLQASETSAHSPSPRTKRRCFIGTIFP